MHKKCLIGFDGYMDEVYRPVCKYEAERPLIWKSMKDFGISLSGMEGRNADVPILPVSNRCGGNAPLMAGAIAALGIETCCIGMFDNCPMLPAQVQNRADWISIGPCNRCIALEFSDGKLMLSHLESFHMTWKDLIEKIPQSRLEQLLQASDLFAVVNWSAFLHMNEILEHIEQLLRHLAQRKILFFDLADFSARSSEDVRQLILILQTLSARHHVVLGLNQKESELLGRKYYETSLNKEQVGKRLADDLAGATIVIHSRTEAECWHGPEYFLRKAFVISHPKILTGSGDHFNAGFCCGILKHMSLEDSLALGNRAAGYYISHGTDLEE